MSPGIRNYGIVTAAYWGFTLTDGALRMLVLLHFFQQGYSPFVLSFLFLLYEAAGIAANMIGGWLATRHGITRMLTVGLATQIAGFLILAALSPGWAAAFSIAWVVMAQGVCGIAKDLTKTASKSAIKIAEREARTETTENRLFAWVAWFTGSKNAMKGAGFFLGGLLLQLFGFRLSLLIMAAALAVILAGVVLLLPPMMGKSKASSTARELFGKSRGVNLLAAARIFLFGARDIWFVVGVPVFLYANGWTFTMVGGFMAVWTILYGLIQAGAPAIIRRSSDGLAAEVPAARFWSALLALTPALIIAALGVGQGIHPDLILVTGLGLFGAVFAINSAIHSYLILAYAGSEKAAEDVGFYYAANAAGRFCGTLLSGVLFQWGGITACLTGSALMLVCCWVMTLALPTARPANSPAGQ
ncbi:organoarsenical effux MFS transporter ArsJ [Aestuariivirga sp.]|jgi:predicted MFS family arabinose efflux permease|uniref:organoarsenical effux MFS transporter ArsJ n=1 Tax=Aestuariivirga sp. TaxID=2650926 RepID=UPI003782E29E